MRDQLTDDQVLESGEWSRRSTPVARKSRPLVLNDSDSLGLHVFEFVLRPVTRRADALRLPIQGQCRRSLCVIEREAVYAVRNGERIGFRNMLVECKQDEVLARVAIQFSLRAIYFSYGMKHPA